jgi:hypothetical protein
MSRRRARARTAAQRTGLADSAGLSYEAYNFPGRYIRHYNHLLYVR